MGLLPLPFRSINAALIGNSILSDWLRLILFVWFMLFISRAAQLQLARFFLFLFLIPVISAVADPLPVFEGAVGFGTSTPAGSGRHLSPPATTVRRVTTLHDSGPGSLRECIAASGPRVCIFEVGGRIALGSELLVQEPYLTIAGQSAPTPGILLTGSGLRIATHDVLVQHLQIRVGDAPQGQPPEQRDGLTVAGKSPHIARNVVLDHLSVSWAVDENFSVWYETSSDVTLSNSIIAEGLYRSIHPDGPHSMGVLIGDGVKRISLHGNLIANNQDRNPRLKPGAHLEFINNVVYGWGGSSSWNQANLSDVEKTKVPSFLAFMGNLYRPGGWSPKGKTIYATPAASRSRVYALANYGPSRTKPTDSEWKIAGLSQSPYRSLTPPFVLSGILPMSPEETFESVLTRAGSRPAEANSVDLRIISEVTLKQGGLKDCVSGCSRSAGGYPAMDSTRRPLSPPANPNGDSNGNGYTNLEDWLQLMAVQLQ